MTFMNIDRLHSWPEHEYLWIFKSINSFLVAEMTGTLNETDSLQIWKISNLESYLPQMYIINISIYYY